MTDEHFENTTRPQIEHLLKRPLREAELVRVGGLADLTLDHKVIVNFLVGRQLVLTALYIRRVTNAHVALMAIKAYMDDLLEERRRALRALDELIELTEAAGGYCECDCHTHPGTTMHCVPCCPRSRR